MLNASESGALDPNLSSPPYRASRTCSRALRALGIKPTRAKGNLSANLGFPLTTLPELKYILPSVYAKLVNRELDGREGKPSS
jgi:hypothetical protein